MSYGLWGSFFGVPHCEDYVCWGWRSQSFQNYYHMRVSQSSSYIIFNRDPRIPLSAVEPCFSETPILAIPPARGTSIPKTLKSEPETHALRDLTPQKRTCHAMKPLVVCSRLLDFYSWERSLQACVVIVPPWTSGRPPSHPVHSPPVVDCSLVPSPDQGKDHRPKY